MPKVKAGTIGGLGSMLESLKTMFTEDNGNISSTRLQGYGIVALIAEDVGVRGNPLTWYHVALFGVWAILKAVQKFAEKPAQGVINAKALEFMLDKAIEKKKKEGISGGENEK
jgi:hypothetical protein